MEEKVQAVQSNQLPSQKKPYSTPALVVYGKVKDLTAGGSGKKQEAQPGVDKNQHL